MIMRPSVVGVGVVGSALVNSLTLKGLHPVSFDKFKDKAESSLESCMESDIMFLCLPTVIKEGPGYDKTAIYETCLFLNNRKYQGIIVLKSTVEPGTTVELERIFKSLKFVHNPEFLSADTAFEDFHTQKHVVLGGKSDLTSKIAMFFKEHYPEATISECTSTESESMKICANSFYAVKIQFFNEIYLACQHNGADYEVVRSLMLKNGWINPQHTQVPGKDKQLSYGGMCFPKDTVALENYLSSNGVPCGVLSATIKERDAMRLKR
jgi:nucleotide sugar dehydrogenase